MLDLDTIQYQGGGISPTSYQTVTTTEDKFYQTFDKTITMLDPTGVTSVVKDLLGWGPEDWSSVEERHRSLAESEISYAVNKYVTNSSKPEAEKLTDVDRFLSTVVEYHRIKSTRFSSSNSINAAKLQMSIYQSYLDNVRAKSANYFTITPKTENVSSYNMVGHTGSSLNNVVKGSVTYMVYKIKPVIKTKEPVQTVDVTGSPVTDVGTGLPTADVNIPTDSPYFEDKPKENEGSFNWLYVIIPAAVVGLWKLGEYLFKNKKKKK